MTGGTEVSEATADGGRDPEATARTAVEEAIQSGTARPSNLPEELQHLPERDKALEIELKRKASELEHGLKGTYATWILILLGGQLLIADGVFVAFAWAGEQWHLSAGVIEVWLAATVVQVVGSSWSSPGTYSQVGATRGRPPLPIANP